MSGVISLECVTTRSRVESRSSTRPTNAAMPSSSEAMFDDDRSLDGFAVLNVRVAADSVELALETALGDTASGAATTTTCARG